MKQLVKVVCVHYRSGHIRPLYIIGDDDKSYSIDKITEVCLAASVKSGGAGVRYTCRIHSAWRYLFLENSKWFIEKMN